MQIRGDCVFRERDQRLSEGYPEQDDKGEKTYQARRARGLARLMPATLRQRRQLTCVHGNTKTLVGSLVASLIMLSSSTINNLRSIHTISRCHLQFLSGWFVGRPELKRTSKAYPTVSVIRSLVRSEDRHHGSEPMSVGVHAMTPTFVSDCFNLGENQTTTPSVGTKRKDIECFGLNVPTLECVRNRQGGFIGAPSLSALRRSNDYSFLRNARSNQFAICHLSVAQRIFLPTLRRSTARDDVFITALLELGRCGADAIATDPSFNHQDFRRQPIC